MKGLKASIIDTVQNETGIKLTPKDIQLVSDNNILKVKLWDQELYNKRFVNERSLESEEFSEDLVSEIFDEYYDLREKIVELKLIHLNETYGDEIYDNIIEKLEQKKVDDKLLDMLDVEFTDTSTSSSKFDDAWDYPVIALRITDYEGFEYNHKIDVYKEPLSFDYEKLSDELVSRIR